MNEQSYNEFLQTIEAMASDVKKLTTDQQRIDKESQIKSAIERLNNRANDEFSTFIAQDPQKYDSAINNLKQALSYNSDLANSIFPSTAVIPVIPAQNEAPADATQGQPAAPADTTQPAAPAEAPAISEPTQDALNAAFAKYMGSSFNPNSSMDKGKMEAVKNALKKFQEETGKQFDINDSEDLNKMRPIMNAAYQSEEYKKVAGVGSSRTGGGQGAARSTAVRSASAPRQQTAAQRRATTLVSDKRGPEYLIKDKQGRKAYYPAVQADIDSGQPLFMRNPSPNPIARAFNPYVPVDTSKARRARPVNQ